MTKLEEIREAIYSAYGNRGWGEACVAARAAIEVMREPTDDMVRRGEATLDVVQPQPSIRVSSAMVWQAMLNAILNEKP